MFVFVVLFVCVRSNQYIFVLFLSQEYAIVCMCAIYIKVLWCLYGLVYTCIGLGHHVSLSTDIYVVPI